MTFLVTLIAGSENNRNLDNILDNILAKNPNSPIAAIIQEFKNREGPNLWNIGGVSAVVLLAIAVEGIRRYGSRIQAAGPVVSRIIRRIRRIQNNANTTASNTGPERDSQSNTQAEQENENATPNIRDLQRIEQDLQAITRIEQELRGIDAEVQNLINQINQLTQQNQDIGVVKQTAETLRHNIENVNNSLNNIQNLSGLRTVLQTLIGLIDQIANSQENAQITDTLPELQNALNNSQQALGSLTQARQALEFEKIQAEVPTLIAEFTEEWRNNRLNFNQLKQDFRSIELVLPQQSQESNTLPTLQELRRVTGPMGAAKIGRASCRERV